MSIMKYEIGGNEVKIEGSEGIVDIPQNRTLLVEQLTKDAPASPELVQGLETIEDVFDYYQPKMDVVFENEEGQSVKEDFIFRNVGDFNVKKMTENSPFLNDLKTDQDSFTNITRQLRSNKVLMRATADPEKKKNILSVLQNLQLELEESINSEN